MPGLNQPKVRNSTSLGTLSGREAKTLFGITLPGIHPSIEGRVLHASYIICAAAVDVEVK